LRQRWLGATGRRVPQIAVEGEDVTVPDAHHVVVRGERYEALVLEATVDEQRLREAHARGVPVVVRASSPTEIKDALSHPEVACALVPVTSRELRDLDLIELTYG
jgi:hypothetical protein